MHTIADYELDTSRVVANIDIDCFGVQLAFQDWEFISSHPCATRNKGVISSANREAKRSGVYQRQRVRDALEVCPELELRDVTTLPLQIYEQKSDQLRDVVNRYVNGSPVEPNGTDELCIDLTAECYPNGNRYHDWKQLQAIGALVETSNGQYVYGTERWHQWSPFAKAVLIVSKIRQEFEATTGLKCSAGISYNKFLAKIACNHNKPNSMTVLMSKSGIARVFETTPIDSVEGLRGKLGQRILQELNVSNLIDLREYCLLSLTNRYGADGGQAWQRAWGIDCRPVIHFVGAKQIAKMKSYYPKAMDSTDLSDDVRQVCKAFVDKLNAELRTNGRVARRMRVECFRWDGHSNHCVFDVGLDARMSYQLEDIYDEVMEYIDLNQCNSGFRVSALDMYNIRRTNGRL